MEDIGAASRHGRIVVGVDGSEHSKAALRWAARQAALTGWDLQVVMAVSSPGSAYAWPKPILGWSDGLPAMERSLSILAKDVLAGLPPVEVAVYVAKGSARHALVEEARDADLLVVGSRGHSELTGLLLGSVSAHCTTHARCPVVVVRHGATAA